METFLTFLDWLEALFGRWVVAPLGAVFFWDVWFWDNVGDDKGIELPIVVLWLVLGALFFTLRFQFVNVRAFRHAIDCVRGRYSSPDDPGEISHFQALSAALSATVGLGNIAGVAVAVAKGGPGAVFWMVMMGLLGMSSKFAECTLGQKYRIVGADGKVSGGPMHYLGRGLAEIGMPRLGRFLAVAFALMCIGGSFGGGNMFQSNQAWKMVGMVTGLEARIAAAVFGAILAAAVGVVIIGGIRRIGHVAAALVPFMCGLYLLCGLWIVLTHADQIGGAFATILTSAFRPEAAAWGGFMGVLVQGLRRAAFSNEAGIGSAPIAHSAAITREPVREGMVALLEPFIDTVIVCSTTGLVIVVTGAYLSTDGTAGIELTAKAFASVFPWFPVLLAITATLFAFSTMISWSYYGERCWSFLFGARTSNYYKALFLLFAWFGAVSPLAQVIEFSDLMILGMAFPNIPGVVLLSGRIKADLDSYLARLRAGEFARH